MNYDDECRALLAQLQAVANERDRKWVRVWVRYGATNPFTKTHLAWFSHVAVRYSLVPQSVADERWVEYVASIPLPTESEEMPKSMTARRAMLWGNLRTGNQRTMF